MKRIKAILNKIFIIPAFLILLVVFGIMAIFGDKTIFNYNNMLFGGGLTEDEILHEFDKMIFVLENTAIIFWIFVLYLIIF